MDDLTTKLAEALRLISFASMDRGARDTATEALAAYEQAQAEPAEPVDSTTGVAESIKADFEQLRQELEDTKAAHSSLCQSVHKFNMRQAMSPKSVSGTSEPVAWRLKSPPGSTYTAVFNPGKPDAQTLEYWGRNGGEIEYAYAAPVAWKQPAREEIEAADKGWAKPGEVLPMSLDEQRELEKFKAAARAALAATPAPAPAQAQQADGAVFGDARELRQMLADCEPYLKEGETPAQRIERERRDTDAALSLLIREKNINQQLREQLAATKAEAKPLTEQEVAEAVFDYYQHFSDAQDAAEACFDKDLAMFRLAERACAEAWGVKLAGQGKEAT